MREWLWRHRTLMLPLAAVLLVSGGLLVLRISGTPWPRALFSSLWNSLLFVGVLYLYFRRERQRKTTLAKQGSPAHLRYPGSRPGSLQDRWAGGIVSCRPGRIMFQEVMSGTAVPLGAPKEVEILDRTGPPRAAPPDAARHQLPPGVQVLTFRTPRGPVELAAEPPVLAALEQQVLQSGPTA